MILLGLQMMQILVDNLSYKWDHVVEKMCAFTSLHLI